MTRALASALLLFAAGPAAAAFSGRDAGTAGAQFLKLGADARSAGMGSAVRALCEDANAVYWNPAGLAALNYRHATMTHAAYYQSVFYDFLAYAQPIDSVLGRSRPEMQADQLGAVGVAAYYLNAGSMGEIDNTGTPTGQSFTPQDLAAVIAWGGAVNRFLDVGVGLKYITSQIKERASTGAVDLAFRLHPHLIGLPWTIAFTAQNLGGDLKFIERADPLPLQIAVSQSLRPTRNLAVTADVVMERDDAPYPSFGVEYRRAIGPNLSAAGRAGWEGRDSSSDLSGTTGLSFGAGMTLTRFGFDYAWVPYGALGDTHRFSLSYRF